MKVYNYKVVFQEFPNEITLALNISGCPNHCAGCHSWFLWQDTGDTLDEAYLDDIIKKNDGITCIGFMGGDQDPDYIEKLARYIKINYPSLKIGWYSGKKFFDSKFIDVFNYIKIGPYIEKYGGLDKATTNQVMFEITEYDNKKIITNITKNFYE